jgi:dienelactone hydrolase
MPRFPGIAFVEVRYRVKSWHAYRSCVEDAAAAFDAAARPAIAVGFSMGGGIAISASGDARVGAVLGLSPWIPEQIDLSPLRGKRFDVVHGGWDRWFPGIPGVSRDHSRTRFEDALAEGAEGTYTLVPRGLHGVAVRSRRGRLVTLPRAGSWLAPVAASLARFSAP